MRIYYIIDGAKTLTMTIKARPYTIFPSHPHYEEIVGMLDGPEEDIDPEAILEMVDQVEKITKFAGTFVEIKGGEVFYRGEVLHSTLVERIIAFSEQGQRVEPLARFLHNLMENPSYRSREQLYSFLERYKMPITPDGHFMAYKAVTPEYLDWHSRSIKHVIGEPIEMDRRLVSDDPTEACSAGLHCCSWDYLRNAYSSGRILLMKVNPRDVVSVPHDHSCQKMRVCLYTPVEEVERSVAENYFGVSLLYTPAGDDNYPDYDYEEDEYV